MSFSNPVDLEMAESDSPCTEGASGRSEIKKKKLVELQPMSQLGQGLQLFLGAELCMDAYRASFDLIMIPSTR